MTRRPALPRAEQGSYMAVAHRVTPVASALYAEEATEAGAPGAPGEARPPSVAAS
jgi:hypothetical protein